MAVPPPRPVLDTRRFGRTPLAFLLVLGACCLVAIITLVAFVRGGPVPALTGLFLALLPVPVVLAVIFYLDRVEPEPRALLVAMFGAGAGVAAVTALLGRALDTGVITVPELGPHAGRAVAVTLGAAIGGAIVAETLQAAVLVALLSSRRAEIDGALDGVVYASTTGLGFALIANVYAYAQAERGGFGALAAAFARRGVLGPLWEPLCTSMIGLGIAYAASRRNRERNWGIAVGWVAAVVLNVLWNDSVTASTGRLAATDLFLLAALAAVAIVVVADRRRIVGMISMFLPAFEDPAVVTASDIVMLASLRLRRLGRQWARLNLGTRGKRAMAEYQLAATELAMACNRNSLGRTTQEAFVRHRNDSLSLMRAAAEVVRAREPLYVPPWLDPDDRSAFVKAVPESFGGEPVAE
jgi:RsiW-degrading membrane proteinase PrsW (M82 family)